MNEPMECENQQVPKLDAMAFSLNIIFVNA